MFFPTRAAGLIRLCWQLPGREGCQLCTATLPTARIGLHGENISPATGLLPSRATFPGHSWLQIGEGTASRSHDSGLLDKQSHQLIAFHTNSSVELLSPWLGSFFYVSSSCPPRSSRSKSSGPRAQVALAEATSRQQIPERCQSQRV